MSPITLVCLDADDTLWRNEIYFRNVETKVAALLAPWADGAAVASRLLNVERANIPRSHLTFYARIWEGTSGDCVLPSGGELAGIAFAEIAPKWAWKDNFELSDTEEPKVKKLLKKLEDNNLLLPNEKIPQFIDRMKSRNADFDPAIL